MGWAANLVDHVRLSDLVIYALVYGFPAFGIVMMLREYINHHNRRLPTWREIADDVRAVWREQRDEGRISGDW